MEKRKKGADRGAALCDLKFWWRWNIGGKRCSKGGYKSASHSDGFLLFLEIKAHEKEKTAIIGEQITKSLACVFTSYVMLLCGIVSHVPNIHSCMHYSIYHHDDDAMFVVKTKRTSCPSSRRSRFSRDPIILENLFTRFRAINKHCPVVFSAWLRVF